MVREASPSGAVERLRDSGRALLLCFCCLWWTVLQVCWSLHSPADPRDLLVVVVVGSCLFWYGVRCGSGGGVAVFLSVLIGFGCWRWGRSEADRLIV